MEYTLKDKLNATKDFIEELAEKSWQEIDYIQTQINNITDTEDGKKLERLLKNLLTSYYVFVGGLENFDNISHETGIISKAVEPVTDVQAEILNEPEEAYCEEPPVTTVPDTEFEPFEYFIDFDEPIGEPITDKDLYNN